MPSTNQLHSQLHNQKVGSVAEGKDDLGYTLLACTGNAFKPQADLSQKQMIFCGVFKYRVSR